MTDHPIITAKQVSLNELYSLMKQIYKESDSFSESFDQKYATDTSLLNEISAERSQCYVSFFENKPTGFLFLSPQDNSNLQHTAFFSMGILNEHQGKGIGRRLIQHMIEHRDPTIEIIYLMVRADNTSAIRLYEKMKFQKIATLPKDTKIGTQYFDGILMSRSWI